MQRIMSLDIWQENSEDGNEDQAYSDPSLDLVKKELCSLRAGFCLTLFDNLGMSIHYEAIPECSITVGCSSSVQALKQCLSIEDVVLRFQLFFEGEIVTLLEMQWAHSIYPNMNLPSTSAELSNEITEFERKCCSFNDKLIEVTFRNDPDRVFLGYFYRGSSLGYETEEGAFLVFWVDPKYLHYFSETMCSASVIEVASIVESSIPVSELVLLNDWERSDIDGKPWFPNANLFKL